MATNSTYRNVVDLILNICDSHEQITGAKFGERWQIDEQYKLDNNYPKAFLQPGTTAEMAISSGGGNPNGYVHTLRLSIFDKLLSDKSNHLDVYSDTQSILTDIVNAIRLLSSKTYFIDGVSSFSPFNDATSDNVTGWYCDIKVRIVKSSNGMCDEPIQTFVIPSGSGSGGVLVSGVQGPQGEAGPQGFQGATGVAGTGGNESLSQTLAIGNDTGNIDFVNPSGGNSLQVKDTVLGMSWNQTIGGNVTLDDTGTYVYSDVRAVVEASQVKLTSPNGNASVTIVSPTGFYYPSLAFYNNGTNLLGVISAYSNTLYIAGNGAPVTPLQVSSVVQFPYLAGDKILYTDSTNKTVSEVTLGAGLTFSAGVLNTSVATGPQGNQGLQGPQGLQGITGSNGVQGSQGDQGFQGSQGLRGETGDQGIQGFQGLQGFQGVEGPQGFQGNVGPAGETSGIRGFQGFQGAEGVQGTNGTIGVDGVQGPQGLQGSTGADSTVAGPRGYRGNQGFQGLRGPQGLRGFQGNQGLQGPQGSAGTNGVQGFQGPQGIIGSTGTNGTNGSQGPQGLVGATGTGGSTGGASSRTIYTTTGATVYSVPAGINTIFVQLQAGGGGGCGGGATAMFPTGGGGGGGAYAEFWLQSVAGLTYSLTVGIGGTAGPWATSQATSKGGNGGNTTWLKASSGAGATCFGGTGGADANANVRSGTLTNLSQVVSIEGGPCTAPFYLGSGSERQGAGGGSHLATSTEPGNISAQGSNGAKYGGGAAAGHGGFVGGTGGQGIIIITEYS